MAGTTVMTPLYPFYAIVINTFPLLMIYRGAFVHGQVPVAGSLKWLVVGSRFLSSLFLTLLCYQQKITCN